MTSDVGAAAKSVLEVLAELSPSGDSHESRLAAKLDWFRWLPMHAVSLFASAVNRGEVSIIYPPEMFAVEIDSYLGERLAAVDQLRFAQRSLRVGWLFVAGRTKAAGGRSTRVFTPLVTVPVKVDRLMFKTRLVPAGDVELSPLIEDVEKRERLEDSIEVGGGAFTDLGEVIEVPERLLARLRRLKGFASEAAEAAGFDARTVVPVNGGPEGLADKQDLVIVAGAAVFALHDIGGLSRAATLRAWDEDRLATWTAFHSLYVTEWEIADEPEVERSEVIESPYPLSRSQCTALQHSRTDPLTVVAGPAGTGKSHTVAAIGLDAIARGQSVLVTARSDAAVDALIDLFERAPATTPVIFGSAERREELSEWLAAGRYRPTTRSILDHAKRALEEAVQARDDARDAIIHQLQIELVLQDHDGEVTAARAEAPGLFDFDADVDAMSKLRSQLVGEASGWRRRRRRRAVLRELSKRYGVPADVDVGRLVHLLSLARADHAARQVALDGVTVSRWDELATWDKETKRRTSEWLALNARDPARFDRRNLRAIAALATALRSGRAARRAQLARLDDRDLTRALPIWVGTLPDVDDLLPPVPGLFDLVIFDEASSIEQPLAASGLLRASRAVVVGDPRQLRHVSFLADDRIHEAVDALPSDDPALHALLDVRRNSLFDAAAGAAPVVTLDEHFRSAPHLVEFVLDEFYEGEVTVATRSPASQAVHCSAAIRLSGRRDERGVVVPEVARIVKELNDLKRNGARSVGVVTPFRAQADALEDAVLDTFRAEALERMDLRVGTAHAFQGNERDVVLVSLGIGEGDGPGTWRHVEDPHLLAVLLTRARQRMSILYSADPPAGGPLARYLAQVDLPARTPEPVPIADAWTERVFSDLSSAGAEVSMGYPCGRHVLDLCVGDASSYVGVETRVHPEGPEAHIERHLELGRAGWPLRDAFPSRWRDRPGELVIDLMQSADTQ